LARITLAHGSGGLETGALLRQLIFSRVPDRLKKVEKGLGIDFPDDSAAIPIPGGYLVLTIDSYTVSPLIFPGGDLGKLAAAGTINDVLMLGGIPMAALDAVIVEEGLEASLLTRLVDSMISIFVKENVSLIGGDLKVMPSGQLDKAVITTACVGFAQRLIIDNNLRPGDKIIMTGNMGEHGAAILAAQHQIESREFSSDVGPLTSLMAPLIREYGDGLTAARDPTRGGVAMVLNDWARSTNTTILVYESELPLRDVVSNLCEMLGVDPLALASEGAAILGVRPSQAEEILDMVYDLGYRDARVIGEVKESQTAANLVVMKTLIGGYRILEPPSGEIVPRIC
jgi:hydrogenase expression/formation protein HypE